jgi:hypothetical protein
MIKLKYLFANMMADATWWLCNQWRCEYLYDLSGLWECYRDEFYWQCHTSPIDASEVPAWRRRIEADFEQALRMKYGRE